MIGVIAMVLINPIGDNLEVGTRIHWDASTENLYYVDVPTSYMYRYRPSTNEITKAKVGNEPLGFAFPVEGSNDTFIAALGRKLVTIQWDGVSSNVTNCTVIAEVDTDPTLKDNRLNGGKVDPYGRLWAGTMGPKDQNGETIPGRGSLYSLSNGKLKQHVKDIGISNGLAFNTTLHKMYYIDTLFPGIYQFDYDDKSGEISNRTVIFRFKDHGIGGSPDGLTIDQDGNLWVAMIFGSALIQVDPRTGTLLKKIQMPTSQITAVSFGGPNLDVLYVNTARMAVNGTVPEAPAGSTFKVANLGGIKGLPGDRYKP